MRSLPVAALLTTLLAAVPAAANGRFPLANQLVVNPSDPSSIVVRTTFGMLVSRDRATFRWICEAVIGYGGVQDPGIGVFGNGAVGVAAFEGLAVSQDGGCAWAFQGGGLAKQFVIDLAVEPASPLRGVAITSTGVDVNVFHVQVFETGDGAKTWSELGVALATDLLAETIDVAPSNPKRLYVSGTVESKGAGKKGAVETSVDRGASWTRALLELAGDQSVFIGAVDPLDEKRVYLRTRGSVGDRLIVSSDGGGTFASVATTTGPMLGLAVSPDGTRVAIGGEFGVMVAGKADLAFQKTSSRAVSCLKWEKAGLYACGNDFESATTLGATIAVSADEGKSWQPILPKLASILGPLDTCTKGGSYDQQCQPLWPPLATTFGVAGAAGAGGTFGGAGSGGAGRAGAAAITPPAGGTCGCSTPRPASALGAGSGGAAAIAVLLLRRRRRRQLP